MKLCNILVIGKGSKYIEFDCNRCGKMISTERGEYLHLVPMTSHNHTYYEYLVCPDCANEIRTMFNKQPSKVKYRNGKIHTIEESE